MGSDHPLMHVYKGKLRLFSRHDLKGLGIYIMFEQANVRLKINYTITDEV